MKTLEKNEFMQEMNLQEMEEVNGGVAVVAFLIGLTLTTALCIGIYNGYNEAAAGR